MAEALEAILTSYATVIGKVLEQIKNILTMTASQPLLLIPMGVAFCGWCFAMLGRAIHKS